VSMATVDLSAAHAPLERPHERKRGLLAMWMFIATEAMLFVLLFFAYFYLASSKPHWPLQKDPSYWKALIMLGILLVSSLTAHWGQKGIEKGSNATLLLGLGITLFLGVAFLGMTYWEYSVRLNTETPWDNAYASITYTITTLHLAHLILGMSMLSFVFARAVAGHFTEHRYVAVQNSVRYWHFVDLIWLSIVIIIYLSPQFFGGYI
jgi:heme/copper-type cytochrome/quinol oxidase subunit 3